MQPSDLSPLSTETPDAGNDSESVASVDSVADNDATHDGKATLSEDKKRKTPTMHLAPPLKKMKTREAKEDSTSPSLSVEHIEGGYVVVPIALLEKIIVSTKALTRAQDAFKKAHLEYQEAFREWSRAFNDLLNCNEMVLQQNNAIEVEESDDSEADEPDESEADEPDDFEADEPVVDETEEVSVVDNAATPEDLSDEDDSWIEPSSP